MRKQLNIPVVSSTNTRISTINYAPESSGVIGIGVIGVMVIGRTLGATDKDARYVNCFKRTVADEQEGKSIVKCIKRSGLGTLNTPQSGSIGTALLVWTGNSSAVITAFGGTNSSIYNGTTQLATNNADTTVITGKATSITETSLSGTATIYITSTDNTGWYYQPAGTVTKISDAQYPGNNSRTLAGFGAHMDGYAFQMDTRGSIWNSDLNSITSWTATGVINANLYPDQGVGCIRWKTYIIGFGTESMEFFYNARNASGSPLSRIPSMAQKIGAVSADAITAISDTVFFCGSTPAGGLSVFTWDGGLSRISPPEIDNLLLLAGAGSIKMTVLRDWGMSFVLIKAGSTTYAYVVEEKFWFVWKSDLGFVRFAGLSTGTSQVSYGVSELSTSGKVFTINPQNRTFLDNGMPFAAVGKLQTLDPGSGAFVSYERAEIKADVESSSSPIDLVWSDDDYQTWSNSRSLDLGTNIPVTTRMGRTRKPRAYSFSHSANTPFSIEELRLMVNVGAK